MGYIVKVWNVVSCFLLKMSSLIGIISMSMCVLQVSYLAVSLHHFVLSNRAASSLCLSTSCFRVPHITRVRNIVLKVSLRFCVEPKALCFFVFPRRLLVWIKSVQASVRPHTVDVVANIHSNWVDFQMETKYLLDCPIGLFRHTNFDRLC